nr:hypothetical protein [Tanacetum cinerariifolium]
MANANNANRNLEPREAPVARKCSYKEFMSCQPFNFKVQKELLDLSAGLSVLNQRFPVATVSKNARNWQTYAPLWCQIPRNSWKPSSRDYLEVLKEMLPPLNLRL